MSQAIASQASDGGAPVNAQLVESLAQIILALTEDERRALAEKLQGQPLSESEGAAMELSDGEQAQLGELRQVLLLGVEQLNRGEFTEYTDETLPGLAAKIRERGQRRVVSLT